MHIQGRPLFIEVLLATCISKLTVSNSILGVLGPLFTLNQTLKYAAQRKTQVPSKCQEEGIFQQRFFSIERASGTSEITFPRAIAQLLLLPEAEFLPLHILKT